MGKAASLGPSAAFSHATTARSSRAQLYDQAVGRVVPDANGALPVNAISQNPDNPRDHLRDLDELTQTVRELGVINPITVATIDAYLASRPDRADDLDPDTHYIVVDGHRRLEASRRAGEDRIKVLVDDDRVATDEALLEAAFVSNYHRDNMNDLEEANALEALVRYYGSQTKAAQRLGIAQATISSKLSLLKLTPVLQADLAEGRRQVKHVRNLGKLDPEQQVEQANARAEAEERERDRRVAAAVAVPAPPAPAPPPVGVRSVAEPRAAVPVATAGAVPDPRPAPATVPVVQAEPDKPRPPVKMPWPDGPAAMDIVFDKLTQHGQRHQALARYLELLGGPDKMAADLKAASDPDYRRQLIKHLEQTL